MSISRALDVPLLDSSPFWALFCEPEHFLVSSVTSVDRKLQLVNEWILNGATRLCGPLSALLVWIILVGPQNDGTILYTENFSMTQVKTVLNPKKTLHWTLKLYKYETKTTNKNSFKNWFNFLRPFQASQLRGEPHVYLLSFMLTSEDTVFRLILVILINFATSSDEKGSVLTNWSTASWSTHKRRS